VRLPYIHLKTDLSVNTHANQVLIRFLAPATSPTLKARMREAGSIISTDTPEAADLL